MSNAALCYSFNCHGISLILSWSLILSLFIHVKQCDMSSACLTVSSLLACGIVTIMCLPVLPQPTWQQNSRRQWWLFVHRSHRYNGTPHLIMMHHFVKPYSIFVYSLCFHSTSPYYDLLKSYSVSLSLFLSNVMLFYKDLVSLKFPCIKHISIAWFI